MSEGLMPPRFCWCRRPKQANDLATQKPEDSPFAIPTTNLRRNFQQPIQRLRDGVLGALRDSVLPAYVKFTTFLSDEYAAARAH